MNQDYPKDLPLEAVALLWDKVRGKQVPLGRLLHAAWIVLGYALSQLTQDGRMISLEGTEGHESVSSDFDPREAEPVLAGIVGQTSQMGPATWLILLRLAIWIIGIKGVPKT